MNAYAVGPNGTPATEAWLPHALQPHLDQWSARPLHSKYARLKEVRHDVQQMKTNLRYNCAITPALQQSYLVHEMSGPLNERRGRKLNGLTTFADFERWISKHNRPAKLAHALPPEIKHAMQHDVVLLAPERVEAVDVRDTYHALYCQHAMTFASFDIDLETYRTIKGSIDLPAVQTAKPDDNGGFVSPLIISFE